MELSEPLGRLKAYGVYVYAIDLSYDLMFSNSTIALPLHAKKWRQLLHFRNAVSLSWYLDWLHNFGIIRRNVSE